MRKESANAKTRPQILLRKTHVPVSRSAFRRVEEHFGVKLPENFKEFYLKHNGGVPSHRFFPLPYKSDRGYEELNMFMPIDPQFPIVDDSRYRFYTIARHLRHYAIILPKQMIPFGLADIEAIMLLNVGNDQYGSVWIFEQDAFLFDYHPTDPEQKALSAAQISRMQKKGLKLIDLSFDDFLRRLQNKRPKVS